MTPYNPYAPPPSPYGAPGMPPQYGGPYREFEALVMPKTSHIPGVCVKCSSPAVVAQPQKRFQFTPQWVLIAFLVSPLIGVILSSVMRKSATFHVPLCASCDAEWKKGNRNLALSFVPGVLMLVLGIALMATDLADVGGVLLGSSILVLIFAPVVMQFSFRKKRTIWAKKIDDRYVWLVGVHPVAIDAVCNLSMTMPMPTQQMLAPTQPYGYTLPPHIRP